MPYTVEVAPAAEREFRRLPRQVQLLLASRIDGLAKNPRPHGVKKLEGTTNRYRIRQGDYRIIYEICDQPSFVIILNVRNRKDAY